MGKIPRILQLHRSCTRFADRYSPLPQYSHRTRFLIVVQLPLLESYHTRIASSLDAFETLSSTFMRAVPGALGTGDGRGDGRKLTAGVEGVQRLCKALVSAKYIAGAMEMWGEDLVSSFWRMSMSTGADTVFCCDSSSLSYGPKSTVGLTCVLKRSLSHHCPIRTQLKTNHRKAQSSRSLFDTITHLLGEPKR